MFEHYKKPFLLGHRGCSGIAPENTIPAFEAILEHDIPGVEIDIHICSSGELVVVHDSNLKRVTGVDAVVEETPYRFIRELDAGGWFHEQFSGTKIPLLEEVLDLFDNRVVLDIEIKSSDRQCGPMERKLVDLLLKRDLQDQVLISSFNPYSLKEVHRICPGLNTAIIYSNSSELPWPLRPGFGMFVCRPSALKPSYRQVSRASMFLDKRIGNYPVLCWTVDEVRDAERLLQLGVDGIISNVPERLKSLFE